ncbi:MAG TPA: S-layer homology domain-containing protein [bacterium]|jgi:hypothetical protein|nr:S-layer homology domain-containing protein [bacterium]
MAAKDSRLMAVLLTLLLVTGSTSPALAAGFVDLEDHWAREKVNDLVTAGIISLADQYRPRDPVTRADFIKMLVLASGLPHAVSYPATFSDVRQDQWFYEYVETAAYHGVARGDSAGKFRPHEGLTREQMASLVMRALKDESDASASYLAPFKDKDKVSSWAEVDLARAVAKGFISGTDQGFLFPTESATRDQAAAVIWELWQQGKNGQTPTVPPAEVFGATAIAMELNRVKIVFTDPVDKANAAQTARYRIVPASGLQTGVPIKTAQVAADGRSVILTSNPLVKGTRYLISVLDLTAGGKTHTLSLYFTAGDSAEELPLATPEKDKNVEILGPKLVKITFTEDLNPRSINAGPEGNFSLVYAGTVFSPGVVTEAVLASAREVLLTVPELQVGERYTLTAHDLRTIFGGKLSPEPISFSFTVQKSETAPTLLSLKCNGPESLELTFDHELDPKDAAQPSNYRLRETSDRPQQVWVMGRTAILIFPRQFTVGGTYTLELEPLADLWGNKAAASSRTLTVAADKTPPEAIGVNVLSGTEVEVLFTEQLVSVGDIVLRRQGRKVDIRKPEQTAPGRVLIRTELDRDDSYELELRGAFDAAGNKAATQNLCFTFTGATPEAQYSEFPPQLKQVQLAPGRYDQLLIRFSQAMDTHQAERRRNYWLTWADDLSREIEIESAEPDKDGQEVLLTLSEPLEKGRTYRYFVAGLEDISGKELIPEAGYLVPEASMETDSFVQSVAVVDANRLELVFARAVQGKLSTSNYGLVEKENGRLVSILGVDGTADSNRVSLRLGRDLEPDQDYLFSAGNNLADETGKRFTTFNTTVRHLGPSKARFRLQEAQGIDNRSFRLLFNRPVQEVRVDLSGYRFQYEYYDAVVLVLADKSFRTGDIYRPEVWARDNAGQELDWRSVRLQFGPDDQLAEVVAVAAATSQRVKAEFGAPLDVYTANDERNFWIETETEAILRPVRAEYDPARLLVWLTLPTTASLNEERYHLMLDGVRDVQGNKLSVKNRYRFYGVDTVPPVVILPHLINQEGLPIRLVQSDAKTAIVGGPGAVEAGSYIRVYIDNNLVAVGRAEIDGSFRSLELGRLQGRRTLRLVVTDEAGNCGERSQVYEF